METQYEKQNGSRKRRAIRLADMYPLPIRQAPHKTRVGRAAMARRSSMYNDWSVTASSISPDHKRFRGECGPLGRATIRTSGAHQGNQAWRSVQVEKARNRRPGSEQA